MASFVSAREMEAAKALKKQEKREARGVILKHAKADYERRKKRKERQEDEWMAPGIVDRFDTRDSSSHIHEKRKNKEKKKDSKRKRAKCMKSKSSSESSSDGLGAGDDEWVEKGQDLTSKPDLASSSAKIEPKGVLQRESWMTAPVGPSEKSLFSIKKRKQDEVKSDKEVGTGYFGQ